MVINLLVVIEIKSNPISNIFLETGHYAKKFEISRNKNLEFYTK